MARVDPEVRSSTAPAPRRFRRRRSGGTASCQTVAGTVLLVEDDRFVLEVVSDIVRSCGFDVLCVDNGTRAIRVYERRAADIVCVILDFEIPGVHPSRVVSRIRELDADVRVLLSSGYPESQIVSNFPLEIVDGFIAKPYDPELLIGELRKVVAD